MEHEFVMDSVTWIIVGVTYIFLVIPTLTSEILGNGEVGYGESLVTGIMIHLVIAIGSGVLISVVWVVMRVIG